jgi:hypothetical protein
MDVEGQPTPSNSLSVSNAIKDPSSEMGSSGMKETLLLYYYYDYYYY